MRASAKPGGVGVRVRVEDALAVGAGPVARAAHLVGVGLVHHVRAAVGCAAGVERGGAAGEPGDGQVQAAPEEVDGTDLADEPAPEHLEDPCRLHERLPEPLRLRRVVGRVALVGVERDRTRDLDGHRPDRCGQAELVEERHQFGVEAGHRAGLEGHRRGGAVGDGDVEAVGEQVQVDLEASVPVGDQRRGEPACRHVQGHVPPMAHQRRRHHPYLAHDLRPELQGVAVSTHSSSGSRGHAPSVGGRVAEAMSHHRPGTDRPVGRA